MGWHQFMQTRQLGPEDQDAVLEQLYREMFRVAYARTQNKCDALDVVQESWVKILLKVDTLRDRDKLVQWARAIAGNTAYQLMKTKYERKLLAFDEELGVPRELGEERESSDLSAFIDLIRTLDPETRKIFAGKFYYGLKDREIADIMKMPLGTVKARIHRGKQRLKTIVDPTE